ncbi:Ig-like domain-containing protein [Lederbergia panacisoli]|uniref:Ig-like domain-containing protein n=1 Tax=Lederbergia panacisoli TaxID=1255251 RepID=UPI00214B58B3|nr:Ig-like domain-containing protein [Lederbergia panacisoli]MCR2821442.1 Ig-like domain-containing protein [Lederbergia panacisoli]
MRRVLSMVLMLVLIFPAFALAESETNKGEISGNLIVDLDPEKDMYLNPADYPLKKDGDVIAQLSGKYWATQSFTLDSMRIEDDSTMGLRILYESDETYYKDGLVALEFFRENQGSMEYVGTLEYDTYDEKRLLLTGHIPKSLYTDQPYVYVRLGIFEYDWEETFSSTALFKVKNPFGSEPSEPTPDQEKYVLVSNESVNPDSSQPTGTFSINNDKYTINKNMDIGAYQLDVNKPFDVAKHKAKKLQKSDFTTKSLNKLGDSKSFWVTHFVTNADYQVSAKLLYSGTKANVWVHNNEISPSDAEKLGKEFDQKIHPLITENFANESDVDGDGKLNILCFDIQDGFNGSGAFVGGYFWGRDLFDVSYSNRSEIFYIDTYPTMGMDGAKDLTRAYSTLAHEFQHMVNFNQNIFIENNTSEMDDWLNEGLSMAAEQIYVGEILTHRIDYYNNATSITNGHSLLYWDNSGDVLANYALSYLFTQYVRTQTNQGNKIFKEILVDKKNDYQAVENAIKKYVDYGLNFGKFMTNFRGALLLKEGSGKYSFNGEVGFNSIQPKLFTGSSANLKGGGAVVKKTTKTDVPAAKGQDITYTFFDLDGPDKTQPAKPVVNAVSDQDTAVKGTAEAGTTVYVKAGSTSLGNGTSGSNGAFSVTIAKQKAGTVLTVYAVDKAGNEGVPASVTVLDKTAPATPTASQVSDKDKTVTGGAEAGSKVTVKVGTKVLGTATASSAGQYTVTMSAVQKAGTVLSITATDKAGNESGARKVTVIDKTAPATPTASQVSDKDKKVTGSAEAGSKVTVKAGTKVLGTATASSTAKYSVTLSAVQKAGTVLSITATDKAGNVSAVRKITVVDKTAPAMPTASKVSDKDKKVTGNAEAGSKVTVKVGTKVLGTATADKAGKYTVSWKTAQKAGTVLSITATDKAGNVSAVRKITVVDKTAPAAPKVNKVTIKSTSVSGKAEANSTVYVKVGSKVIASGKAGKTGSFSIKVKKQKSGTILYVYAKDKAGNTGKATKVTVKTK